jgi:hypothetical protein
MAALVLGPLLRYADDACATIWVETDSACEVEVCGAAARTFRVGSHHYALVVVDGLDPRQEQRYDVRLDGEVVWPEPDDPFPPPVIRLRREDDAYRLVVGSCRAVRDGDEMGPDALRALALRMMRGDPDEWPHALLFVGDQVYADEVSPRTREFLRARRDTSKPPYEEVADFEEYAALYAETWSDPVIRWLLATVPSAMIFDDHDVHDDWNTSEVWRRQHQETSWWQPRIVAALASYWVYQHLGNLSPDAVEKEGALARLHEVDDGWPLLADLAARADAEADGHKGHRWSFARQHGSLRLLVIDSRCGRVLSGKHREMVDEAEWRWIQEQLTGDVDHLLVATSLPVLLPPAISFVESWNEAVCGGAWGSRLAGVGEKLRQGVDLEHWAAFRKSFTDLMDSVRDVAAGRRGRAPASVVFLSGDVHYAYLAEVRYPQPLASHVYQVVSSPMRNPVPVAVQYADRVARTPVGRLLGRLLARSAGVPDPPCEWRVVRGAWFDNNLATVQADGQDLAVTFERATGSDDDPALETLWAGELVRARLPDEVRTRVREVRPADRAPRRSPR